MTYSTAPGGSVRSIAGKLAMACAFLALVAGAAIQPAFADGHGRGGHGGRGYGGHGGYGGCRGCGGYGPYYAPYQVYAPPPVYYPPQPSPGVSLFFPIRIR